MSPELTSPGELFQLFRSGSVATRTQLQQVTGLARSTVTPRVEALLGDAARGRTA